MDIQFPARDRHRSEINELIQDLTKGLKNVSEIKTKMVKFQKFEQSAEFRDVEKHLEKSIEELKNIVRKHYT